MAKNTDTEFKRAMLRSSRRLRLYRLINSWPFFAWFAVMAVCGFLYVRSTQYGVVPGTAQIVHIDAAPLQAARIKEIYVKVGDHVTNGQIVVQMDTTLADVQVAQPEAMLSAGEITLAQYEGQMQTLVRTFDDEILRTMTTIEQQKNQRDSDSARLTELKSIQAVRDKLYKVNVITEEVCDALRPEIAGLEQVVASYPSSITMQEQAMDDHKKKRADLQKSLRLGPDDNIMAAIAQKTAAETAILKTAVDMQKLQRETYTLRAEADGVVSDVMLFSGSIAQAATPIVRIVTESCLIIGYLPELRRGLLKTGDHAFAFRMGRPPVKVVVVGIAPEIDPVPVKLSPISAPLGVTFSSQRIVFRTEEPSDITSGEKVQIRMESESWSKISQWLSLKHSPAAPAPEQPSKDKLPPPEH